MPRISWINEDKATGEIKDVYEHIYEKDNRQDVADILKCFSAHPRLLALIDEIADFVHFQNQYLDRVTKEMIATYVSGLNRCQY